MNLDFRDRQMDVGTESFDVIRALSVAPTKGAALDECLAATGRIRKGDRESWIKEWLALADDVLQKAEKAHQAGSLVTAREAYLRASNYTRTGMYFTDHLDPRRTAAIRKSREAFEKGAGLLDARVEPIRIPFEGAEMPGYFLPARRAGKRPTLMAVNGGDSTNEELVHWIGFAAAERGWNFLTFEGPGQWSALQMNPSFHLRADYEAPAKAVVDWLVRREEVDEKKIALIGYSMGAGLGVRITAYEKRICACIANGMAVDVNEAWDATMPAIFKNDAVFAFLESRNIQLFGLMNHFRWMMGVSEPHEVMEFWKPFSVKDLAPKMDRPVLLLYGEAEYAQTNERTGLTALQFMKDLPRPASFHEFLFDEGWAASHCQVGGAGTSQPVIFDWLEKVVNDAGGLPQPTPAKSLKLSRYFGGKAVNALLDGIQVHAV